MTSSALANTVLGLAYNGIPNLTSNSSGVIGIDTTNSVISNEAALGNGFMFLGNDGRRCTQCRHAPTGQRQSLPPGRRRPGHRFVPATVLP